jgi:hypothetical protein
MTERKKEKQYEDEKKERIRTASGSKSEAKLTRERVVLLPFLPPNYGQTDRQRQRGKRQTDRQTGRQTDGRTGRRTDGEPANPHKQTHTNTHTHTQRERESQNVYITICL